MKRYETLDLEIFAVTANDIISTSVVIGDKGNTDGGDTSWGDIGGGKIKE